MENIILSGMLAEFRDKYSLQGEKNDSLFEKFSNYCILKNDHYDSFDFDKVSTGQCVGVDGVAVSINGILVDDIDEVARLTQSQFDAKFIFIQAKTSTSFDIGDYLKFINTAKAFFGDDESAVPDELITRHRIKNRIYSQAAKMRSLPDIGTHYVYAGDYQLHNSQLEAQIKKEDTWFTSQKYLCSSFRSKIVDGKSISRAYRETKNEIVQRIPFQRHLALPPINGAQSAYLGVMACNDFIRMIEKENGELNKGLFIDNVRDFLGEKAPVNEEIAGTISDEQERDKFAILNNGITVVAKRVVPSGDFFEISQFQVVNGCQTSNVLYKNRLNLSDNMYLTVKLIETSDIDLSGRIIATTNSQSQVTKEAFATIKPYHRTLEDYFNAMRLKGYSYYYERRPHQFDDASGVTQQEIVSAPLLIKSFVSLALEEPHKVHYYYGSLLREYTRDGGGSQLFDDNESPGLYFAVHHIVALTKRRAATTIERDWTYHLALLIKREIAPNLRQGNRISDKNFMQLLNSIDQKFDYAYNKAVTALKQLNPGKDENRTPSVTTALAKIHQNISNKASARKGATPPRATPHTSAALPNGNYVGLLHAINENMLIIKYGPFLITTPLHPGVAIQALGSRVPFVIPDNNTSISFAN
ncbi:AIPR family protein [Lysobacter enzymogenes]|uniref:AIPR family protein n=1 Tax=Lysobacter enzymogenes TaxID=69 RepID=UPI003748FFC1